MESKRDNVKHPSHYAEGRQYEPKDVIRDWGLNFNLGSAVKYLSRAGRKADIVEDLRKAQEFIQFEIDAIEAERSKGAKPKAPQHVNCRCTVNPTKPVGDITKPKIVVKEINLSKGTPKDQRLQQILDDLLGEV